MTKTQFRRLVVCAVEYACIFLMIGVGIVAVCFAVGGIFNFLGVG